MVKWSGFIKMSGVISALTASLLIFVSLLTNGCNHLNTGGTAGFGAMSLYVQPSSTVSIYSYKPGSPTSLTQIVPTSNSIEIPQTLLFPIINSGVPTNPLLYIARTDPSQPVPVDLILKVYSPNSPSPDFYFEIPILGSPLTPTNTTTALSWILRWSAGSGTFVSISLNQFNDLVDKVEVACTNCRTRSTTDVVSLILNDSFLTTSILNAINASNPTLNLAALNYQPPSVDYVWSSAPLSANWQVVASGNQPVQDPTTASFTPLDYSFDVLFVDPNSSTDKIRPISWAHSAKLAASQSTAMSFAGTVSGTPLLYSFDDLSAGLHEFDATFDNGLTQPFSVMMTINQQTGFPFCLLTGVINARVNKTFQVKLDKTIAPEAFDITNQQITRISSSNIAATSMSALPTIANGQEYTISFTVSGSTTTYQIAKQPITGGAVQIVVPSAAYVSGQLITFDSMALILTGIPVQGDYVSFTVPYDPNTTAGSPTFVDQLGCMDSNPSTVAGLAFIKNSGPPGMIISSSGTVSWMPLASDYDAAHPTKLTPFSFTVSSQSGGSQTYTGNVLVGPDHLPVLCLQSSVSGNTCGPGTTPIALPVSSKLYNETFVANEVFAISDVDGDPVLLSAAAMAPPNSSFVPLVIDSFTNLNLFKPVTIVQSTMPSLTTFDWQFTPSALQVTSTRTQLNISNQVMIQFAISYNTGLDPSLYSQTIETINMPVTITNYVDPPFSTPSPTAANCGAQPCSNTNVSSYVPSFFTVPASGQPVAYPAKLTLPRDNTPILIAGNQIQKPLVEGDIGTIQVPITAVPSDGITPIVYSIDGPSVTCPFLNNGRVKVVPSTCSASPANAMDCLTLMLNYNQQTGLQDPIPYYSPQVCSFTLTAHTGSEASAWVSLGTYSIYIQDINNSPTIRAGAPVGIENVAQPIPAPKVPFVLGYPVEGQPYDLRPFITSVFNDPDLGAYNGPLADVISTQLVTKATGTGSQFTLLNFNAAAWEPEMAATIGGIPTGGSISIQESADDTTWSTFSGRIRFQAGGSLLVELNSNSFVGSIAFQTFNKTTGVWSSVPFRNLSTGVSYTSLTNSGSDVISGRYIVTPDPSVLFAVNITSYTSGSLTGSVIGNYNVTHSAPASGQTPVPGAIPGSIAASNTSVVSIGPIYHAPISSFTAELPGGNPASMGNGQFLFTINPAKPYIRAVYTAPNVPASGATLPTITVQNTYNQDPRENSYVFQCWIVGSGPTYTSCGSVMDSDNNYSFSPSFPSSMTTPSISWTPPYSVAADGNLSAAQSGLQPSFNVLLRMVDKGYFPNTVQGVLLPPPATCNGNSSGYSCIDYTFPLTVIETPAVPTTTIFNSLGNAIPGAKWRPQNTSLVPTMPTFTVNEGATVTFTVQVQSYSTHQADLFPVGMKQTSCTVNKVACQPHVGGGYLLIEPGSLTGNLATATPVGGPLKFTFTIHPNSTDGDNPLTANSTTYAYRYKVGQLDSSGNFVTATTQTIGFNIVVNHVDHSPTSITFPTKAPTSVPSGTMCTTSSQVCQITSSSPMAVTINRATSPAANPIVIPLQVNDPDMTLTTPSYPQDNLTVSINKSGGFNNTHVSVQNIKSGNQPYSFIVLQIPSGSICQNGGGLSSSITVPLIGTDNRPGSSTVSQSVQITIKNVGSPTCLN